MEFYCYHPGGTSSNGSRPFINGHLTNAARVALIVSTPTKFLKTKQWIMGQLGLGDRNHRGYYVNTFGILKANGFIRYDRQSREWVPGHRATQYISYIHECIAHAESK